MFHVFFNVYCNCNCSLSVPVIKIMTMIMIEDGDVVICSEVVCSDEFLSLPVDQVSKLIANDQLAISSEEQVFVL